MRLSDQSRSIVALHGDGGHWKRSWTDRDSGFFWLSDVLPINSPNIRVLSYGYRTGSSLSVEEIAFDLMNQLEVARNGDCVRVCSSEFVNHCS